MSNEYAQLHQRRVAVILDSGRDRIVIRGEAQIEEDDVLGDVLRVNTKEEGDAGDSGLLLRIQPSLPSPQLGDEYECDFSVHLTTANTDDAPVAKPKAKPLARVQPKKSARPLPPQPNPR